MSTSVYSINKGINQPIKFKGLQAQYIWYLAGGIIVLFILFTILYVIGLSTYICLGVVGGGGGMLFAQIYKLSNRHGEFGMMKKAAQKMLPDVIKTTSRKEFFF